MTRLIAFPEDVFTLPEPQRSEVLSWSDEIAPGYWVITSELVGEGRVRLQCVPRVNEVAWWDDDFGHFGVVTRAVYTNREPPVALMMAMASVSHE